MKKNIGLPLMTLKQSMTVLKGEKEGASVGRFCLIAQANYVKTNVLTEILETGILPVENVEVLYEIISREGKLLKLKNRVLGNESNIDFTKYTIILTFRSSEEANQALEYRENTSTIFKESIEVYRVSKEKTINPLATMVKTIVETIKESDENEAIDVLANWILKSKNDDS
jgi:hypothetical protein